MTPRTFGILLSTSFAMLLTCGTVASAEEQTVFIGTYTDKTGSKGIYSSVLDVATGKLSPATVAAETSQPSFVAIHPTGKFLYAVNENDAGTVTAFAIDPKTHALTQLNQQSSNGKAPCHLTVDKSGKTLVVVNYTSGSLASIALGPDGKLGEIVSPIQHEGSSATDRQKGPHAHSVNLDAANKFAFVADLGLDKVMIYKLDPATGKLTPNDPPSASVPPGSGPRHFSFTPDNKYAYAIEELSSKVSGFKYDADKGTLTHLEDISTLPAEQRGNSTAEVLVHPSGKFVYGSNRGHNSIAIFAIDPATGKLTAKGHQPTGGRTPRNFAIDPSGTLLLAENQGSNSIVVFRIDPQTGLLTDTGNKLEVPSPVCVRFLKRS